MLFMVQFRCVLNMMLLCAGLQKPGYIAHMWAYTETPQRTQEGERKGKEREGKEEKRKRVRNEKGRVKEKRGNYATYISMALIL